MTDASLHQKQRARSDGAFFKRILSLRKIYAHSLAFDEFSIYIPNADFAQFIDDGEKAAMFAQISGVYLLPEGHLSAAFFAVSSAIDVCAAGPQRLSAVKRAPLGRRSVDDYAFEIWQIGRGAG